MRQLVCVVGAVVWWFSGPTFGNGVSFFERVAVEKGDRLEFIAVPKSELPPSTRKLLTQDCPYNRRKDCVPAVLALLKEERGGAKSPNIRAWKFFLEGLLHFETGRYEQALPAFEDGARSATDAALKTAIAHRALQIHLLRFDVDQIIEYLDWIQSVFPEYDHYDSKFSTYPLNLCSNASDGCISPPSISVVNSRRPQFMRAKDLAGRLKGISNSDRNAVEYVAASVELAKIYNEVCPERSMFANVCPRALKIFEEISKKFSNIPGVDYAFLMVQRSRFSYEYEGNRVAYARDIVKLFGEFLERYPESEFAEEVRVEYKKALNFLEAQQ